MSLRSVATRFVDLCNQGKNFDVMRSMYAPSITSVEGDGSATAGQQEVIQKSQVWAAKNEIRSERVRGPYYNGDGSFAVHYTFEVTRKDSGKRVTLEEVGVYTVENDRITREEFLYDGEH